ncbi:MAG: allophanate hydrolase subunit 2 family protein [Polyangiaceae bacterium]
MITVVAVTGLATVQDAGRPGHMHEGVPPGGPLVPELLARANAAVGNEALTAGLELFGAVTLVGPPGTVVACDDGAAVTLEVGASWRADCAGRRVRYVAVRGGVDVPRVLGGRGTLLGAAVGGLEGRALRSGDPLRVGEAAPGSRRVVAPAAPDLDAPIRVVPGPDLDRLTPEALRVLLGSEFRVDPASDRVGIRLAGPLLGRMAADTGASSPMVRGAIQVPPSGAPIVLGPDHPTTGGYPVLAVVARSSLGSLGARPIGAAVRFVASP